MPCTTCKDLSSLAQIHIGCMPGLVPEDGMGPPPPPLQVGPSQWDLLHGTVEGQGVSAELREQVLGKVCQVSPDDVTYPASQRCQGHHSTPLGGLCFATKGAALWKLT